MFWSKKSYIEKERKMDDMGFCFYKGAAAETLPGR